VFFDADTDTDVTEQEWKSKAAICHPPPPPIYLRDSQSPGTHQSAAPQRCIPAHAERVSMTTSASPSESSPSWIVRVCQYLLHALRITSGISKRIGKSQSIHSSDCDCYDAEFIRVHHPNLVSVA
jgi:hypothetical protein